MLLYAAMKSTNRLCVSVEYTLWELVCKLKQFVGWFQSYISSSVVLFTMLVLLILQNQLFCNNNNVVYNKYKASAEFNKITQN